MGGPVVSDAMEMTGRSGEAERVHDILETRKLFVNL